MTLAIASGKGGTGKTTLAVNLARAYARPLQLLDCDVEEPNAHLFLPGTEAASEVATIPVPEVDESRCDGCGECSRFCAYHAIVSTGTKALVFAEMCHGCGGCPRVCPRQAIREVPRRIGMVERRQAGDIALVTGRLDVGSVLAPPLIREVKRRLDPSLPAVIDAPPGTSCPVVTAVRGADFVLLVTEPTPFGLHDLQLAVDTLRELAQPFAVVLNRAGAGDDRVHRYCREAGIAIMMEIADDRRIAEAYSRGRLVFDAVPEYRALFSGLADTLLGGQGG
ncbi:MAG TPA: ATP-binding protein [Candidatus Aminicenantes bacterium]|nr:ATP-binding protein [Candidatus Aminicenantes bacterium]